MDTAERTETPAEQLYDGFISYSHAADGLLAPRLQAGLQRFAKPWWKRRALRVFRDESSLSANPHLWSSITDALDTSGWFVLLLSPDAAQSEWVNQEVAYWVEHRDPDRIIPVVTAGTFGWQNGDVTGTAVPDALLGALSEEPRWVDLRFADEEDQLSLQDPRFADAVADIASAMRGVPKDDLASEEVRQHKRTTRTAWGAGAVLVVLLVASVAAALTATNRAAQARANQLATASVNALDSDPELSLLLALAASVEGRPTLEQTRALHAAIDRDHLVATIRVPIDNAWTTVVRIAPDGDLVAVSQNLRGPLNVFGLTPEGPELRWSPEFPEGWRAWTAFTADSEHLIVFLGWPAFVDASLPPEPAEPELAGLHVFDAQTGELVFRPELPPCAGNAWFATLPAYDEYVPDELAVICASESIYYVIDPLTGAISEEGPFDGAIPPGATLSQDATKIHNGYPDRVVVTDRSSGEIWEMPIDSIEHEYADSFPVPFPGSGQFLYGHTLLHPESGQMFELAGDLFGCGYWPGVNASGTLLAMGCEDGTVQIVDPRDGKPIEELIGHTGWSTGASFTSDGRFVATGSADGTARVWDLSRSGEVRLIDLGAGHYSEASISTVGDRASLLIYPGERESLFDPLYATMTRPGEGTAVVFDIATGQVVSRVGGLGGKAAPLSPDGTRLVAQQSSEGRVSDLAVFNVASGEVLMTLGDLCPWEPEQFVFVTPDDCEDGSMVADATDLAWSPDGRYVAMAGGVSQRLFIWDTNTRDLVFTSDKRGVFPMSSVAFNEAGTTVVVSSKTGMWVHEVGTWDLVTEVFHSGRPSWEMIFTSNGHELITAQAHSGDVRIYDTQTWSERDLRGGIGQTRDIAVSSDETLVAIASRDGSIHVLQLDDGDLVDLISLDNRDITNVEFIDDDQRLLITSSTGPIEILTLDPEELVRIAGERASRDLTAEECQTFDIDPCPTLQEMREG